ncbi:MAG: PKD domain-containing protein, partial [Anaerolineales bacterium]|nr:PKD domain-containing protein [Anaerolineales bacterium]
MEYTASELFSTVDPKPIARVDFNVTGFGDSPLDLRDTKISDVKGRLVPLIEGDGNFRNLLFSHDLSVLIETPIQIYFGDSSLLNVTVYNYGVGNETDVEIRLLINGTLEDSTFISELLSLDSYPWSYQWTPATTGVYNITAYAPPVAGEQHTGDNDASGTVKVVIVEPTAFFNVLPLNPLEGGIVTFDASASTAVETTIASFKWDFGDGNVTTVTFPIIRHTYAQNGAYTVTLNVTDERGASDVLEKTVIVYSRDVAVVSVVPSSTEVNVGDSVSINVTVTNQGDFGAETFNVITYYNDTTI